MAGTVLMVAFHFPPAEVSSGQLRTLGFARHLPACGWRPVVLSASALAYPRTMTVQPGDIPDGCIVKRAFALDASRHLAVGGRYPGWLARPDRWASWCVAGIAAGMRLIARYHVDAIWSTYPIMSAHCIAYALGRRTGLPWVADFRDPVLSSVEPGNAYSVASQRHWEQRVIRAANRAVFTTPGALESYAGRYPQRAAERALQIIENGYDEALFTRLPTPPPLQGRPLRLVHSGLLYADGRNPAPFFEALAHLKTAGVIDASRIRINLRASGADALYRTVLKRLRVDDLVELSEPVSNRMALEEQARADGLLLFQGARFDRQIPAKLYEYLRIGRPILALVGDHGDTARLLRRTGGAELVPIDSAEAIAARLPTFIQAVRARKYTSPLPQLVAMCSRGAGAAALARMLDELVAAPCAEVV